MLGRSQWLRASSGESNTPSSSSSPCPVSFPFPLLLFLLVGFTRGMDDQTCTPKTPVGHSGSDVGVGGREPGWIPGISLGSYYNNLHRVTWWLRLEWQQRRCGEGDSFKKYLGMRINRTWCLMEVAHPSGFSSGCHVSCYVCSQHPYFPFATWISTDCKLLRVAIMSLTSGCF